MTRSTDSAATETLAQPPLRGASPPPGHIGPWRVLETLGSGGMGVVYLAERDDQEFVRRAAIKVIRAGFEGPDATRRFLAERQILASLDHPNIARLYDGGTLPDGRPYLVLEHIVGQPIDAFCRQHSLPIPRRLELFHKVCSAVAHAHQHLVIHRDLKPSNILVDAAGEPKLLDFGIAKLLDKEVFPAAVETHAGIRPMTPLYASPEQIRGQATTTASDVFTLGVLLYELLTGTMPFTFSSTSAVAMDRVLSSTQPKRPSTVIDSVATGLDQRQERHGRKLLRGDLDNIVLKALREEPGKRYSSVEAMRQDLDNLAAGRPVSATQGTLAYVAGKFLRRHRVAVTTLALVLTVLSAASWLVAVQAQRAARERDRARAQNARAHRMLDFLVDTFDIVDRNSSLGRSVTAKEILDEANLRFDQDLEHDIDAQVRLYRTTGGIYKRLGLMTEARESLETSLELAERSLGEGHEQTLESLLELGELLESMTLNQEALAHHREALRRTEIHLRQDHPLRARALEKNAGAALLTGTLEASTLAAEEALRIREKQPERDVIAIAECRALLAQLRSHAGDSTSAEALLRESLEDLRTNLGRRAYWVAIAHQDLGELMLRLGRLDEAEAQFREALAIGADSHSRTPTFVAGALRRLGFVIAEQGEPAEALSLYQQSIRHSEALVEGNPDHVLFNVGLVNTRRLAAQACEKLGDPAAARRHYEAALEPSKRAIATGTQIARGLHAEVLIGLGRDAEARALLVELKKELESSARVDRLLEKLDSRQSPESIEAQAAHPEESSGRTSPPVQPQRR